MAIKFINDLSVAGTLDFSGASTQFVDGTGAFVNLSTLPQGDVTATSTTTFTNKSGSNNQWTNDAGYTGNTGTTTADNTQTFTNKSGSNSQWTNDEGYTTNTGTVTASSTNTFTNKSGSNSQWTNDEGYTTNTGTTTADNTQTFTNKSGSNNQWTNDAGYSTASGTMSSWIVSADAGSGTITNGATMKIAGGTGISTSESAGTVTVTNAAPNIVQTTITGNAGSATILQTARSIAGVSFNGSSNISLNNNAITNGAGYITSGSLPTVNNGTIKITATDGLSMNGVADGSAQFNLNQTDALQTLIIRNTRSGTIGGSGTTNFVPLYTGGTTLGNSVMSQSTGTQNAKFINLAGRLNISGNGGDANGGTVRLTSSTARLGIATSAISGGQPEASLDVGKNARVRGSLNVGLTNEQYLFVSTTGDTPVGYVKMGYYGTGTDYDLSGGAQSSTQYTTAFNNGGKICEDERIMTFKLSRTVMASLSGAGKELIPQDSNFTYIVKEAYLYAVPAGSGTAPTLQTGTNLIINYQTINNGTRTTQAWRLPDTALNDQRQSRKVMFFDQSTNTRAIGTQFAVPKSSVRITTTSGFSNAGSGTCDFYLRMRVKNIDFSDDISNNSQLITIT